MIEGRASAFVHATPSEVIAFVLDLERYRHADRKIAKVRSVHGDEVHGEVVFTARLRGLPTPADRQTYQVSPDGLSLEFRSAPSRWPGLLARFHGVVRCEPVSGGTRVTHIERFTFSPVLRWLLEPYLHRWLRRDTSRAHGGATGPWPARSQRPRQRRFCRQPRTTQPVAGPLLARARASRQPFATRRSPTFGNRAGRAADGSVTERHILLRDVGKGRIAEQRPLEIAIRG